MRMNLNTFAVPFLIACATILAGVAISLVNDLTPLLVGIANASKLVLVSRGRFGFSLRCICANGKRGSDIFRYGRKRATKGAILTLTALFFVHRHWLGAVRTVRVYLHAVIANSFYVGRFCALKPDFADQAFLSNSAKRCRCFCSAGATVLNRSLAELGNLRGRKKTGSARREVLSIAGFADSVITGIVLAYLAAVFHAANIPQITRLLI